MLDRLVARIPLLLLLGVIALNLYAAFGHVHQPRVALASAPASLLAALYLRAGKGGARAAPKAKAKDKPKAKGKD